MNDAESAINVLRSCADGNRSISVYPREARSLVDHLNHLAAENERLAREVAYLKACSPPTNPGDYGHEAWADPTEDILALRELRRDLDLLLSTEGQSHADVMGAVSALVALAGPLRNEIGALHDRLRAALEAENDRLEREVAYLKACVPPTHPRDYGHEAWAEAVRAAVAQERAAVVAWLRGEAESLTGTTTATAFRVSVGLSDAADAIERGAHR